MVLGTFALGHVLLEVSDEIVPVVKNEDALPFLPVALPEPDVHAPVPVYDGAQAAPLSVNVLSLVGGPLVFVEYGSVELLFRLGGLFGDPFNLGFNLNLCLEGLGARVVHGGGLHGVGRAVLVLGEQGHHGGLVRDDLGLVLDLLHLAHLDEVDAVHLAEVGLALDAEDVLGIEPAEGHRGVLFDILGLANVSHYYYDLHY